MALSVGDQERAIRALKRSIIKRDNVVSQFSIIAALGSTVEADVSTIPIFHARSHDLTELLSNFHSEQDAILDQLIMLGRESEFSISHAPIEIQIMDQYYLIKAVAAKLNLDTSVIDNSMNTSRVRNNIQLPKIQLPTFDGNLLKWCSYRDTFTSLVHENTLLSDTEKFHYLISTVSGTAAPIVKAVPLTDANYTIAWDALQEMYNNKRVLVTNYLDVIFHYPAMTTETLTGLTDFVSAFRENIAAIHSLEVTDLAGFLLFYIASRVLSTTTKRLFEAEHGTEDLPTLEKLLQFVQTRCHVIQNSSMTDPITHKKQNKLFKSKQSVTKSSFVASAVQQNQKCFACQGDHFLYKCDQFRKLAPTARLQLVKLRGMCTNCLSATHKTSACSSKYTCRYCSKKHHSFLHSDSQKNQSDSTSKINEIPSQSEENSTSSSNTENTFIGTTTATNLSVLGTAVIRIQNKIGHWIPIRALIDSGSQISAITSTCATRLGLTRQSSNLTVVGLSQSPVLHSKGMVIGTIIPRNTKHPQLTSELVVLSKITGNMPTRPLGPSIRMAYPQVNFADPQFDYPGHIDFLLGADLYNHIFLDGYRVRHTTGLPSAFETVLGWIIVGSASQLVAPQNQVSLTILHEPSLKQLLSRFWTMEEPMVMPEPFTENEKCENHFCSTSTRDNYGRYSLSLPFKSDPSVLGESRQMALSRFYNLERKLQNEPALYTEYRDFMNEYLRLGHMELAQTPGKYIIPHHAVVKRSINKIKLRVVFDASARTSSGVSLNELLFIGPKLQCDIADLLLRCRLHVFMFTADICKMYRQIGISSADCAYQHILWRNEPSELVKEYSLSTVTYGVSSSPFQAIRVLHQLEIDEGSNYPAASSVLSSQTYVDDVITGANTIEDTLSIQTQLIKLLACGGFELKKWASNCEEVLKNIPEENQVIKLSFDPKDDCSIKILGLHWDPKLDVFSYHSDPFISTPTKRSVLSSIAKIYDPLGVLAPITFWAKHFMQLLWKNGYDWDQPISKELATLWNMFSSQLPMVSSIKINRHIPIQECIEAQLIGFSDASLKGYSAVVYIRLVYPSEKITVHLLTSKSRVAPVKSGCIEDSVSIPRMELCGALLLAETLNRVQKTLSPSFKPSSLYAWTDSTVVLSWLTSSQIQFKVFVTNRLKKIVELVPECHWHYVSTTQNPADCVSRGMFPEEALKHNLYWNGPQFLSELDARWSDANFIPLSIQDLPERTSDQTQSLTTTVSEDIEWFQRFSSLTKLQRVIAYMLRFADKTRKRSSSIGYLRYVELEKSLHIVVRLTQHQYFHDLHQSLVSTSSKVLPTALARLSPFVDNVGIIRVGGRLRHSVIHDAAKNPILLPKSCVLSTLLIHHYHLKHLHAGHQLVSLLLGHHYWIISARSAIRNIIFKCVVCTRFRLTRPPPVMADLPPARVRPSRPFSHVGVDYAGPFLIKDGRRKQARSIKCYLALFVCMAVKAVHIEIVSDLTTEAFIAALHRFVSRRGLPTDIYSDCGTNFKGANRDLQRLFFEPAAQELCADSIQCHWHFNPPASPHFGGLWEAAVKSCKHHLKRVVGSQSLTFEEMCTLVGRIEAILNSRPITPQSTDPHDLRSLTPGHFLIGAPIVAIPEPDVTFYPPNRLRRWHLLTLLHQSFWKRWSSEYLTSLQRRAKWIRPQPNIQVDDLVIIRSSTLPPTAWKLGRVELVHPGEDGRVRVVTVRTADGLYKRPVVKLIVLPISNDP